MFFDLSDNPNAQKSRLRRAFLKIHRKDFWLAGGKASVCKKCQNNFKHHTCKNEKTRKISMNMVKQNFRTKANRLEELKNVYRLLYRFFFSFHFHAQHQQLLLWSKSNELL